MSAPDHGLKWLYRLFPKSWHTRPMGKCKHPYCVLLNRRERRAPSDPQPER